MPELMRRVRACSTMPFFMPPITIDGQLYFDGGLGDSWGVPLAQAQRDGYKKFFIVRTQKRGYRKSPDKYPGLTKLITGKHKNIEQRMLDRHKYYNAILDEIETLEEKGEAYVFYPDTMPVTSTTIKQPALQESYRLGYEQARGELSAWRDFL
jgi:predicted patatin/cPLA2 family phospholipase